MAGQWTPERRERQRERMLATLAKHPDMNRRGREVAAEKLKTAEGRAKVIAAANKARDVFRRMGPQAQAAAIEKAKAGTSAFWRDPKRVAAWKAKQRAIWRT